jgi:hypothetical protein
MIGKKFDDELISLGRQLQSLAEQLLYELEQDLFLQVTLH